jgi:hypothetical protein
MTHVDSITNTELCRQRQEQIRASRGARSNAGKQEGLFDKTESAVEAGM